MKDRRRQSAALYGLPIPTAFFGVMGTVLGLMSVPVGAAVAVAGTVLVAAFDVIGRVRTEGERVEAEHRALEQIGQATTAVRDQLAAGMPLGGTTVPDGTPRERLASMVPMLRERRFTFLQGRRWRDWAWLGAALESGRQELLRSTGLTGGRLPSNEDRRIRELARMMQGAATHAYEIASLYAGYDVNEQPKVARWAGDDRDVDVTGIPAYASFADEFASILAELDRMARLARPAETPGAPA